MTQNNKFPELWNHKGFGWLDNAIDSALALRMDMHIYELIDVDVFYHRWAQAPTPDNSKLIYKILWKPTIERVV